MEPFRHLLRPGTQFLWSPELQQNFEAAKEEIVKAVQEGVEHFEIDHHTSLATDWCKSGIGFFLLQKWCECGPIHPRCCNSGWKLTLAGGRFTSPAESRYSPTEGELLAVVDALFKARHFVLGCPQLTVAVDHQPLIGVLSDRSLCGSDSQRYMCRGNSTVDQIICQEIQLTMNLLLSRPELAAWLVWRWMGIKKDQPLVMG